jgi:GT2 family glycosyltransferase
VSIIIPAYNAQSTLRSCLDSVMQLDYPEEKLEIFLIDNNSSDSTEKIARSHPITVLREEDVQSSYAARNRGLRYARGELLVFTDADCIVMPDWLLNYVRCLESIGADIVAGHVEMTTKQPANIFEMYDRCKFDQSFFVREFNFGATANLLVRRTVFERIGEFDEGLISSGDLELCQRACKKGFRIGYCRNAIVLHPSRSTLRALIKKEIRIGFGHTQIYFKYKLGGLFIHRWKHLIPNKDFLRFTTKELNFGKAQKAKFVLVDWLCNWAWICGNAYGLLKLR